MSLHFPDRQVIGHRRVPDACKSSGVTTGLGTAVPGSFAAALAAILDGAPVAEEIS